MIVKKSTNCRFVNYSMAFGIFLFTFCLNQYDFCYKTLLMDYCERAQAEDNLVFRSK